MINKIQFEGINKGITYRNDKIIKFKLENIGNSKKNKTALISCFDMDKLDLIEMNKEKTITLTVERDGEEKQIEVRLRYCTATETGFETMSGGKNVSVFNPQVKTNESGRLEIVEPAKATTNDYIMLAMAAIVASYARNNEEPPVKAEDILYDAKPSEVENLLKTVMLMRAEWYSTPKAVDDLIEQDKRNAQENGEKPKEDAEKN